MCTPPVFPLVHGSGGRREPAQAQCHHRYAVPHRSASTMLALLGHCLGRAFDTFPWHQTVYLAVERGPSRLVLYGKRTLHALKV
jgi:hypothetical protein